MTEFGFFSLASAIDKMLRFSDIVHS